MASVFISYKHDDTGFEKILCDWIDNQHGFHGWYDDRIVAGTQWSPVIDNQIEQALCMIVIVTPAALESHYITYEWSYARGLGKMIIPLLSSKLTDKDLHPKLGPIQFIKFSDASTFNWNKLTEALEYCRDTHETTPVIENCILTIEGSYQPEIWCSAIHSLERNEHPHAEKALEGQLSNTEPDKAIEVALAYARRTKFMSAKPIEALHRGIINELSIEEAMQALGRIGTDDAIEKLIDAGGRFETNSTRHQDLLRALGRSANKIASEYLLNEIQMGEFPQMALDALDRNCHPDIAPILLEILVKPETSVEMKTGLATVLGKVGNASFVPTLIKLTDQYTQYAKFLDGRSMMALIYTIGVLNTEEGNLALRRYLKNMNYSYLHNHIDICTTILKPL